MVKTLTKIPKENKRFYSVRDGFGTEYFEDTCIDDYQNDFPIAISYDYRDWNDAGDVIAVTEIRVRYNWKVKISAENLFENVKNLIQLSDRRANIIECKTLTVL